MQKFSDFSKKVKMEHSELLIQEAKELSIKSEDNEQILESIDVLCNNLLLSLMLESKMIEFSQTEINNILNKIQNDAKPGEEITIEIKKDNKKYSLIINWDGETAKLEIDGHVLQVPGTVPDIEALKGAVEGMLQDLPDILELTEEQTVKPYTVVVTGYIGKGHPKYKEGNIVASFDTKSALKKFAKDNVSMFYHHYFTAKKDGYNLTVPILSSNEIRKLMVEKGLIREAFTPSDLDDAIFNMPDEAESLSGYELKIGGSGDKLTIDWEDPKSGVLSLQLNGENIKDAKFERVYDYETLKQVISDVVGKLAEKKKEEPETEEPKDKPKEITPEVKKKLGILRSIIRPRLINKFANSSSDQTRIYNAIKGYLESGEDEEYIKTELDQKAIIDFCLDLLDVVLSNKNLSGLISRDASATSLGESFIVEKKKKSKTSDESIDVKLDMLLKLGLVDSKLYSRAKKALSNKKSAGTVPYLRNLLFDLLDKLISYIKKDPTLYNRIRLNVMKEMKANLNLTLPMKKEIEEATIAGREAAKMGKESSVPEAYSKHYFTKEAWLEGYNSYVPEPDSLEHELEEEEMKSFKQFKEEKSVYNESISLSEIDIITNVMDQLAGISESTYPTLEQALADISQVVSELGLGFDSSEVMDTESGTVEVALDDVEGQAKISVFGGESIEDKVEGDLSIKFDIEKTEDGVIVKPEIMASFDGGDAISLSDIEFEVDSESEGEEESGEEMEDEEPEEMEESECCEMCGEDPCVCDEELMEAYVDGQTYSVVLFKPSTRRFFTTIVSAKSENELKKIVQTDYPEFTINAIYPVKVIN